MKPSFVQVLDWHCASYPDMEAGDWYKLLHQSVFGVGHLVSGHPDAAHLKALRRESASRARTGFHENLIDPLGADWRLVRLNLRPYARVARDLADLVPVMAETARAVSGTTRLMTERLKQTARRLEKRSPVLGNTLRRMGVLLALDDFPPVHHSEGYQRQYRPAYRVVLKELIPRTLRNDAARRAFETRVAMEQRLAVRRS